MIKVETLTKKFHAAAVVDHLDWSVPADPSSVFWGQTAPVKHD
jgi:hypothetical protein